MIRIRFDNIPEAFRVIDNSSIGYDLHFFFLKLYFHSIPIRTLIFSFTSQMKNDALFFIRACYAYYDMKVCDEKTAQHNLETHRRFPIK